MPVTRIRQNVRAGYASGTAQATANPLPDVLRQNGVTLARLAADSQRVMARTATQEGEALAKSMVFSMDENGVPQLPDDMTGKMGRIAQAAYDSTIEDRYMHRLQTSIRAQIRDAENANMYDPDAFQADAESRLAAMELDIPEGFEGAFQSLVAGEMVDAGLSIGRRVTQLEDANATSRLPVQVQDWSNRINEALWSGQDDVARTMAENLDFIWDAPSHILTDGQKEAYARQIWAQAGATRLIRDLDLANTDDPSAIMGLVERLKTGRDSELMQYFVDPRTGEPSFDMAAEAAGQMNQFLAAANMRNSIGTKAATEAAIMHDIAAGVTSASGENRARLDTIFANDIGFEDPNNPGQRGQLNWRDWFGMDGENRVTLVRRSKDAGYMSGSMQQAFRRAQTSRDPAELGQLFTLYRDLKEAPNSAGEVRDLTGELPEESQLIFELASALHGSGGNSQESVADAISMLDALDDQEWDDKALAAKLNTFDRAGLFRSGPVVTEETAQTELRRLVGRMYDGMEISNREMAMSTTLLETYLRTGHDLDEATDMVKQSMEGRFAETEFMMAGDRSEYAPELHYAEPAPDGILAYLRKLGSDIGANILSGTVDAAEFVAGIGIFDVDFGADRINASAFERMADTEIRRMLSEQTMLLDGSAFDTGWSFFVPGRDYKLSPDRASGNPPVYRIWMRDANDRWFPLPEPLDVREAHQANVQAKNDWTASNISEERYKRWLDGVLAAEPGDPEHVYKQLVMNGWATGDEAEIRRLAMELLQGEDE